MKTKNVFVLQNLPVSRYHICKITKNYSGKKRKNNISNRSAALAALSRPFGDVPLFLFDSNLLPKIVRAGRLCSRDGA